MHPVLFKIGPFTIYSLGLFWPRGSFHSCWIVRLEVHPTQQYPGGTIFCFYLVLSGYIRFIVEFWRANPIVGLGMTEYQWISLAWVILGTGLLRYQRHVYYSEATLRR
jgi:prolipoprotein diacylglyceryltransferase